MKQYWVEYLIVAKVSTPFAQIITNGQSKVNFGEKRTADLIKRLKAKLLESYLTVNPEALKIPGIDIGVVFVSWIEIEE